MACRGVHFALTDEQERKLLACGDDDDAVVELVQEDIEATWDRPWLCETDRAWDAIHRCLTDGKLELRNGTPPLNRVIFGGQQMCASGEYYVCYVPRSEVASVAAALVAVTREQFDAAYDGLVDTDYPGPHCHEDREYTWTHLENLKAFWARAGSAERPVIFTVDQ
jgi:hypothetical protein